MSVCGLSTDHLVKTSNGWKSVEDIDIEKDKLYLLKFKETDYCHRDYPESVYLNALSKNIVRNYTDDLYSIDGWCFNIKCTTNYKLPVNTPNTGCSYSGSAGFFDIEKIISILQNAEKQEYNQRDEVKLYTELDRENLEEFEKDEAWYNQSEIEYWAIKKLNNQTEDIFSFTLPDAGKNCKYLIYIKKEYTDRECWV